MTPYRLRYTYLITELHKHIDLKLLNKIIDKSEAEAKKEANQ